jgi:hypothetical protein
MGVTENAITPDAAREVLPPQKERVRPGAPRESLKEEAAQAEAERCLVEAEAPSASAAWNKTHKMRRSILMRRRTC